MQGSDSRKVPLADSRRARLLAVRLLRPVSGRDKYSCSTKNNHTPGSNESLQDNIWSNRCTHRDIFVDIRPPGSRHHIGPRSRIDQPLALQGYLARKNQPRSIKSAHWQTANAIFRVRALRATAPPRERDEGDSYPVVSFSLLT